MQQTSNFPFAPATRLVPTQAAKGVVARFAVREATIGDMSEPGFAAAFGRCAEAFVALGAFRQSHTSGAGLAPFIGAMGDYAVCLRVVCSTEDHRIDGAKWRIEDLPLTALAPLVEAFNEVQFAEDGAGGVGGKVQALRAMVETFSPALQRVQTQLSRSAIPPSNSNSASMSTFSSAPGTGSPMSSASPGADSATPSGSPASDEAGSAPPSSTMSAPPSSPAATTSSVGSTS